MSVKECYKKYLYLVKEEKKLKNKLDKARSVINSSGCHDRKFINRQLNYDKVINEYELVKKEKNQVKNDLLRAIEKAATRSR